MMKRFALAVIAAQVFVMALLCLGHGSASAQGLDAARQQKLLMHLQTKGFSSLFANSQAAMVGVNNNGEHVPVRKVQFYNEKLMYAFSRFEVGEKGYFFLFDPERSNLNSAAITFRTDLNFQLVGVGLMFVNGKPEQLSPERTKALFAESMKDWAAGIDGKFNRLSGK
jgi:hypothetical protein